MKLLADQCVHCRRANYAYFEGYAKSHCNVKVIDSYRSQKKGSFMRQLISLFCICLLTGSLMAAELATPKGEILLTISGNIEHSNNKDAAEFDLEMLERLGATTIITETPWTDAVTSFTGVRLSVLLDSVGAGSSSFRAIAFDNYWYDIPDVDFEKYPVIVAYKKDGAYLNARSLGPLWIIFPFDDYPALLSETNKASSVWHLNSLIVQ